MSIKSTIAEFLFQKESRVLQLESFKNNPLKVEPNQYTIPKWHKNTKRRYNKKSTKG